MNIGQYITGLMRVFGFEGDHIGYSTGGGDFETQISPILNEFVSFREKVRNCVIEKKDPKEILNLSDKLRDFDLKNVGVRLEDSGGKTVWKLEDVEKLRQEIKLEMEMKEGKEKKKEMERLLREEKERLKLEKSKIPPEKLFLTEEFSKWDQNGIPTHLKDGTDVSKNRLKSLKSEWEAQKKLFEKSK